MFYGIVNIDLFVHNVVDHDGELPLGVVCLNKVEISPGLDDVHANRFGFNIKLDGKKFDETYSFHWLVL